MSSDQVAIKVDGLSKCYHIYNQPQDRLKQAVLPRLQKLSGVAPVNYFREFWALQDVSFEVKKGETVGIIGRNGSGKSTLLQLICRTLSPTIGSVKTNGRIAALLELGSGFNPEFTGQENVYLNGAVLGLTKEEIDSRFDAIAAFADIGDFIQQPVKTYSSGMVVRLAFAVQAMIDPDILVVDEALAVGDEKFQRKCFARLEELKSKGTAILFVSHSGGQIVELCDGALLLENGRRLMYSRPLQVVRAYQKLIYAPPDYYTELLQEYQNYDQMQANVIVSSSSKQNPELEQPTDSASENVLGDYFDPGLIPETTVVYPLQGAEIQSLQILNMNGLPVNVLSAGENYRFEMSGKFLSDSKSVYFGIHIRSVSGVVITGQVHPEEGKYIDLIQAGQKFNIVFEFKMALLPGIYFVGGGVWSYYEPTCLHRIMDAGMFRVQYQNIQNSFGLCDLLSSPVKADFF